MIPPHLLYPWLSREERRNFQQGVKMFKFPENLASVVVLELTKIRRLPILPNLAKLKISAAAKDVFEILQVNWVTVQFLKIDLIEGGEMNIPTLPSLKVLSIVSENDSVGTVDAESLELVIKSAAELEEIEKIDLVAVQLKGDTRGLLEVLLGLPQVRYVSIPIRGDSLSSIEWANKRLAHLFDFHGFLVSVERVIWFRGDPVKSMIPPFRLTYTGIDADALLNREINFEDEDIDWEQLEDFHLITSVHRRVMVWLHSKGVHDESKQRVSDASTVESL